MASKGLAAFSKDPACTNDVDNTKERKLIVSLAKKTFNDLEYYFTILNMNIY